MLEDLVNEGQKLAERGHRIRNSRHRKSRTRSSRSVDSGILDHRSQIPSQNPRKIHVRLRQLHDSPQQGRVQRMWQMIGHNSVEQTPAESRRQSPPQNWTVVFPIHESADKHHPTSPLHQRRANRGHHPNSRQEVRSILENNQLRTRQFV
jgi:hypothetical protein